MYETFVVLQVVGIILTVCALTTLFQGEATYAQKLIMLFILAVLIQSTAYLLELGAKDMPSAMVALKMQYIGSSFVVFFYLLFISCYCGYRIPAWISWPIFAADVLVLVSVWTSEYHGIYYSEVGFVESGVHPHLVITYGIGFWIYMAVSVVVPYVICMVLLIRRLLEEKRRKKRRVLHYILAGTTVPMIVMAGYVLRLVPEGYDPTSLALACTLSPIVIWIWNKRDFDILRVASDTALDAMEDAILVVDEKYRILRYNRSAGEHFGELKEKRSLMEVPQFPAHVLAKDSDGEFEQDGRHYKSRIGEILDYESEVCGYTIFITDMTETYARIQELKRMREIAESANRAKSDFLAVMSHEIRTPMNAIIGMSEFVMEESHGRKVYDFAHNIRSASLHLLSIVNNILDLSKVESGHLELQESQYKVKQLLDEVEELLKIPAMQSGLKLMTRLDAAMPYLLYGDAERIRQIMINVANNAIKFTQNGHVELRLSGECMNEESLCLRIIIEDTGIGIKEEDMERIFEMFQQVDMKRNRSIEGSGLGLAITRQFVELMDGRMRVESEYGKGTRFTIEIPQKIADKTAVAEVPEEKEGSQEKREHLFQSPDYEVLLVDDNRMNRIVAQRLLSRYELRIDLASSGREAIEKVKEKHYEMIFMDHMMPEMDGIETTKILRKQYAEQLQGTVLIALTANVIRGAREMYLENGFEDFLAKPIDRMRLHVILDKWIPEERKWEKELPEKKSPEKESLDNESREKDS